MQMTAMQMDDMILVSIDDHMVEPPDMYENHVPDKWKDQVPKVVRNDDTGVDEWEFQGQKTSTPFGMAATVGWPKEEWGFNPGSYSELRPGCFDVHERVQGHGRQRRAGSMNFPTMAGFNARTFTEAGDKELALVSLRAYNDWAIDEWAGSYPGRFIPLGLVPMWDVDLAVEEVHRLGQEGLPLDQLPRDAARPGLPELPVRATGTRCSRRSATTNMVLSLHIGAGFEVIRRPAEAPIDHLMVLACQISAITAQDLLFGPTLRQFPDLKVALSEGGIGWIPFYFDRIDRHFHEPELAARRRRLRRQAALGGVPRAHPRLLHHRPVRPAAAGPHRHRHHRLGVRLPPHRHDVARVARVRLEGAPGRGLHATRRSTRSPGRTPAGSSTGTPSPTPRGRTRPSAPCGPGPSRPTSTSPACPAPSGRSRTRPPASASRDARNAAGTP